jgi:glycosyltransferase involved in cell wall biosynthesis
MITVLTPSIGTKYLSRAVASVRNQTTPVRHVIVADGKQHLKAVLSEATKGWDGKHPEPEVCWIPDNTGRDKWNGHKIYAHYSQLLDTDYLCLLDEDNTFEPEHCESLLERAKKYGFAWSYRNVFLGDNYIGKDVRESIGNQTFVGYNLVDTSCWMFARPNFHLIQAILTQWSGDRDLTNRVIHEYEGIFYPACTGQHTLNYYAPQDKSDFYRRICED